jgi:hypothetical protein
MTRWPTADPGQGAGERLKSGERAARINAPDTAAGRSVSRVSHSPLRDGFLLSRLAESEHSIIGVAKLGSNRLRRAQALTFC